MAKTIKDYPSVALRPEDLDGKIDFSRIFGRKAAVHIEIGTGKAGFLLAQAIILRICARTLLWFLMQALPSARKKSFCVLTSMRIHRRRHLISCRIII